MINTLLQKAEGTVSCKINPNWEQRGDILEGITQQKYNCETFYTYSTNTL